MINDIFFFFYRVRIAIEYTRQLEECSFLEGWGYSQSFYDNYLDDDDPEDAVFEELMEWTE